MNKLYLVKKNTPHLVTPKSFKQLLREAQKAEYRKKGTALTASLLIL
jgi:hypothetical protein